MAEGDAGARSKTRIGAANIDKILDAALAAFARDGLRGARIEEIAGAAEMSKTNLLYYFRTKEQLYSAVLTRTLDIWLRPLRDLDESLDPATALTAYIDAKLDYSRRYPEASRLFALEIIQGAPVLGPVLQGGLHALVEEKSELIRKWIAAGKLRPIDPLHLLFAVWATTQHYADFASQIRSLSGRDLSDDAFFAETREAVTGILLRGMLA
ncbi:MAG: HTH-type transcriptional regulator RutR [Labrys sp. (in: a-proteobacteria)]|jgi:TetR/AcrR family transcriptional regulator